MSKTKKTRRYKDPRAAREAKKYDQPIASRELILDYLGDSTGPCSREQIAADLGIEGAQGLEALRRRLRAMERDGQLVRNRREGYGVPDKMDLIRGRVVGHPDGFGFLVRETGGDDIFLSPKQMRRLLHGDRALVRILGTDRRGRSEGALVEVLERANQEVVGRYLVDEGIGFVVPDNKRIHQDILIPDQPGTAAKEGQIVVAAIIEQPDRRRQPIGRIVEVLGDHMAPGMEIDVAIRAYDLPRQWPAEVEQAVAGYTAEVAEEHKRGREDLRGLPLVTIDGADARDFDDAVYCEPVGTGWRLLVAIADVSHYVRPAGALDVEAEARGNSVYFPDFVLPMLPEVLSNGLCSLNPQTDRLCLVCELQLGPRGAVTGYRFFDGVMRSAARLTYDTVAGIVVDKDAKLCEQYAALRPHLDNLYGLYNTLKSRRAERGAIEFDTVESRIVFGEDRKIERVVPLVRNDAHKLIEEFMIAANVAAARFLLKNRMPTLFRVHETPEAEKIEDLRTFLGELGVTLPGGDSPTAQDYSHTLEAISGREDAHLIQTLLLRSMRLAVYSVENIGHFGLAFDAYTHFTSPIRRYPDLLVHRAIRHIISGGKAANFDYDKDQMQQLGEHSSMTERRADEATRDAVAWLKCEFMLDKVGEEFDGIVSAVTSFGLFVELKGIHVEGLVHVTSLRKDYYHFDPVRHRLNGERTGSHYRLADAMRVKVMRVDLDDRKIDFAPC